MIYKFTARARKAIDLASEVLENQAINAQKIENEIIDLIGKEDSLNETLGFTPRTKRVLENSFSEAKKVGMIT